MEIVYTDSAYNYIKAKDKNLQKVLTCCRRFLKQDFGADDIYLKTIAVLFGRNFESPEHEHTAFGVYKINTNICFVVFDEKYAEFNGNKDTLIIAFKKDIDFKANDPLQKLIDQVTHSDIKSRWQGLI